MSTKAKLQNEMARNLIDLVSLKITVPLTAKTKNIHTNSWIWLEDFDELDNIQYMYEPIGNLQCVRWTPYRKGYWYVKSTSITYSSTEQSMSIELSPFPTIMETDSMKLEQSNKTSTNTQTDNELTPPSWLSETDKNWAISVVKNAIGNASDDLTKAKAIFRAFTNHIDYEYYANLRTTTPKGNRKKAWDDGSLNCADGANILETLFLTAGLKARIKHPPEHYIVKVVCDDNTYWVDNSRSRGKGVFNQVWKGRTSESEGNITNGEYING